MTNGSSIVLGRNWDGSAASQAGRLLGRKAPKPLSGKAFREKISGTDAGTRPRPVPTYTYRWDGGTAGRVQHEEGSNMNNPPSLSAVSPANNGESLSTEDF